MANFYAKFVKTLFIAALLFGGSNYLFAQNKYWMQHAGGATPDEAYSISLDDSNNSYTTGYFSGTAGFGPSISLSASAVSDIFITKTNSLGVYKWAVKAGDGGADRGLAIKTDKKGNSYITGYYYNTATFGSQNITSAGLQDVFVAKYDRNGNLKWVVSAGGTEADIGNAITLDNSGNVLITGQFTGTSSFGSFILTSTNNNINVFTAKLDSSNGNFLWAKSGTGPHTDRGLSVACDPSGNVYITGQFTDTITFDNVHNSPLYDAIFIVKYDNNGNEQWITTAGGGTYNIANAIAVDNSSNVYITGNFQGNLDFFVNPIVTLTNTYFNRIFVAKYDQNANLLWEVADGSSNPVTANNISLDPAGNPYIIGSFECVLNGYADRYGQGTFNTVGYWDVFTAGYAGNNGDWIWSRQIGGHGNNYGNGIAVDSFPDVFTAGSFDDDMIVPMDSNFVGCNSSYDYPYCPENGQCNGPYCNDTHYGDFGLMSTTGNLDIFIAKPIDLIRQTYDYYHRSGSFCDRPQVNVCINTSGGQNGGCQDTIRECEYNLAAGVYTFANSRTCNQIGPNFNYLWSTHQTGDLIVVNSPGWYYVTATSVDGCFKSTDSILFISEPYPAKPWISDNVIVNTMDTITNPIVLCGRDCILTGGNYGFNTYYWDVPPPTEQVDSVSTTATSSYEYQFIVINSYGCYNESYVQVTINDSLPKIIPKLECLTCRHDTAFLCLGNYFTMFPYDSISNPNGLYPECIPLANGRTTIIHWNASPNTIGYRLQTDCYSLFEYDADGFQPSDSGWYHITSTINRENTCDTDVHVVSDSIFVRLYPNPTVNITITGEHNVCPGDKTWIVAHGGTNYLWDYNFSTADSIYVGASPNPYQVSSTDTNKYGCTANGYATFYVHTVPQPRIDMNPTNGLVCPNDSVELTCSSADGSFTWSGPYGPININSSNIYVKIPGYYNCVRTDSLGCVQLSNTVEVGLYATPYLVVTPSYTICPGDSAELNAIASNGATYNWL
ncbi:MAG TPA: SBBP repeat-containing protein, partial [Bacteroidia bacterium]|nr:SBBP repeat-containing protein [Bacteroidia bacterium]